MTGRNPFGKSIDHIRVTDLNKLIDKQAAGGIYLQYFRGFPDAPALARSVASFCNADGGWLVIGMETDAGGVPLALTGIDRSTTPRPRERIRETIRSQVAPRPHFDMRLINLSGNRSAMVVQVAAGLDSPCLTDDQIVYVRANRTNAPQPVEDSGTITALFRRRTELARRIEAFSLPPVNTDTSQCYLEAYFITQPVGQFQIDGFHQRAFLKALKKRFTTAAKSIPGFIEFTDFYPGAGSYIIRLRAQAKDVAAATLTMELHKNGSLKIFMPLEPLPVERTGDSATSSGGTLHLFDEFRLSQSAALDPGNVQVVDGFRLAVALTIMIEQYQGLLKKYHYGAPLKVRYRVSNSANLLLFFDSSVYLAYLDDYGLPICLRSAMEIPAFQDGQAFQVPHTDPAASYLGLLFSGLGIPLALVPSIMAELENYLSRIMPATGTRS